MDVTIVIVAWNVKHFVSQCLESVYRETKGIEFEVIYVDNGSVDGSAGMVRKDFPQVQIIQNVENRGFVVANNQAIECARGRYVLLLNSDTVILDNAIAKVVRFADQHPEAAAAACRVLNPDRTLQGNCFRFYSTLNMLFEALFLSRAFPNNRLFGRKIYGGWDYNSVREVDVIVGCFSMVRREAIDEVGMMDDRLFMYGDDIDWCYRFVKAGWKVLYTPSAEIIHYGGRTTRQAPGKFTLQLYGVYLAHVKKYYPRRTFLVSRVLIAWYLLGRALYWSIRSLGGQEARAKRAESARTLYRGVYYCLCDWKNMLMNRQAVADRL